MTERRERPEIPIASRFRERLDDRHRWFERWFSRWQMISGDQVVEIDSFGGEPIRTCGLEYSGTIVDVYWDTISRGLRKEIVAQFEWLELQLAGKPAVQCEQVLDVCTGQLISFVEGVRRDAVKWDSILRSRRGVRAPPSDQGRWHAADRNAVIRQSKGLFESLELDESEEAGTAEKWWSRLPLWVQVTGGLVTIIGGIAAGLTWLLG